MKHFRIDIFRPGVKHETYYFAREEDAREFGESEKEKATAVFLGRLIECINKYDMIEEIKN